MIAPAITRRLRRAVGLGRRDRLGVAAVAKNEGAILAEWIAVHAEAGFGRIFVYDNGSTDDTARIVREAARTVDVVRIPWPSEAVRYQAEAYEDCVARFGRDLDWLALIDMDEFVLSPKAEPVGKVLSELRDAVAVALNWQIYGSSDHQESPPGLVTESYVYRAPEGFGPNRHMKSVLRPEFFEAMVNPHFARVKGGYVDARGKPVAWLQDGVTAEVNAVDRLRVNHYITRSKSDWDAKRARGHRGAERTAAEFAVYDRNEVYDPCAARLGAKARRRPFIHKDGPREIPQPRGALPSDFDAETYRRLHADVAASTIDPLDHYITFGRREGRPYR